MTGWSLEFDLPSGVAIDTSYNGTVTTQGRIVDQLTTPSAATVLAQGGTR
ncbi:hypothetical protein PUR30_00510 [Streptomyces sp. JV190]|nr:hypothetical protein [Streptomyces sp. JV190]MEE1838296.1 hypothetical protein [Streptomyces sp. JV190]